MQSRAGKFAKQWSSRALVALAVLGLHACTPAELQTVSADPGPSQPAIETVAYQEILSPVPVRLRLPARLGVDQVILYYRTFGERTWNALRLMRSGQTWYGSIGCLEVSTITGYLQFFLQGQDPSGHVVLATGTPSGPHLVQIAARLESGPTALPGDPPTWRCVDPADCPPGFAGCPSYTPRRPPCTTNADCGGGDYCAWDGYCDSIAPVFQVPIAANTATFR